MFSALIKHEMKWRSKSNGKNNLWKGKVLYVYFGLISVAVLYFLTKAALGSELQPQHTWYVLFALPFVIIGFSINTIKREWKNNTIGWWLSLPYSRWKLIAAKFIANLLKSLRIYLIVAVLAILSFFYVLLLDPSLHLSDFPPFLLVGANIGVILLVVSPLLVGIGMLIAVLSLTGYRYFVPLFWIGFWVLWSFTASNYLQQVFRVVQQHYSSLMIPALIALIPCWLLAYGLLRFVAYAVENKLDL